MLKIRPHHILCMRAFIGYGYSDEFNENMKNIIVKINAYNEKYNLDSNNSKRIEIKKELDSICSKCPHNNQKHCTYEDKVNLLDEKVMKYFYIEPGIYEYKDIENKVYKNITREIFDDICKNCEWYDSIDCKKYIFKKDVI